MWRFTRVREGLVAVCDQSSHSGFLDRVLTSQYGPALRVSFAARVDQICFKLYAAADRREPRDFADLRALKPVAAELHVAARWARTHNMPGPFDDALARALEELGVEGEGRARRDPAARASERFG